MRVGVRDQRRAAVDGLADPRVREVEPLGSAVHLDPRPRLDGGVDDLVEIDRVGLALLKKPSGGVRERRDEGVTHRADDSRGHLIARLGEGGMH